MDRNWLGQVQRFGWWIVKVTGSHVVASCPAQGCGMKAKLRSGGTIPWVDPDGRRNRLDVTVASADQGRMVLRARREDLAWTHTELEEVAGLTFGHIAKLEKDGPNREATIETFILWAHALGYEVVLRPSELTSKGLSMLIDTRNRYDKRVQRISRDRARRGEARR